MSCFLIQPENIVCVSKGSWDIKLIDFGLAQELVPGVRMTALKGTPEFMGKLSHQCLKTSRNKSIFLSAAILFKHLSLPFSFHQHLKL